MNNSLNEKIIKKQIATYDEAIQKYGISSSTVLWDDSQTQYLRFYELIKNFDLNSKNKTILDLGCGNAEFYKFLNFLGYRGQYIGYDINENLLKQAQSRFNDIKVQKKDILNDKIEKKYDYIVISGLFNVNCGQPVEWVYDFLRKAFENCNEILAFNLISTYVNYKSEKMFYLEPENIFSFCVKNLSRRVTLAHHNLPYNYTVQVFKDDNWSSVNR